MIGPLNGKFHFATVQSVSPFEIRMDSHATDVPAFRLGDYSALVGDRVLVIEVSGRYIVQGNVV